MSEARRPEARRQRSVLTQNLRGEALALLLAGASACAPALPPPGATSEQRFDWSAANFENGDYHAAIRGFEDFLLRQAYSALADSAQFLLGEAYLRTGQELLAASEFAHLASSNPSSPLADDAQLGSCRAYWALSPEIELDQEYTERAVVECTRLVEYYPRSDLVARARDIAQRASQKLAADAFYTAMWYLDNELYESAIIYLESVVREYPASNVVPEALAALYESYSTVGFQSEAESVRDRLLREFPETAQARELRDDSDEASSDTPGESSGDTPGENPAGAPGGGAENARGASARAAGGR